MTIVKEKVSPFYIILSAEMYAVTFAVSHIKECGRLRGIICSDSSNAIRILLAPTTKKAHLTKPNPLDTTILRFVLTHNL